MLALYYGVLSPLLSYVRHRDISTLIWVAYNRGYYVTYLLMYFQSMAGWMLCISISLSCCLGDVSQATGDTVVECKVV